MKKINPYKLALDLQDACNLQALARTFYKELIPAVREDIEEREGRKPYTNEINQHPAVQIFCDKLYDLSRARYDKSLEAWGICEERKDDNMQPCKQAS